MKLNESKLKNMGITHTKHRLANNSCDLIFLFNILSTVVQAATGNGGCPSENPAGGAGAQGARGRDRDYLPIGHPTTPCLY